MSIIILLLCIPGIVDDFYLNLLDWSGQNAVAVALGANLFIWNAQTGSIEHLIELQDQQVKGCRERLTF